jgi:RNA polymerase sigma-70 factor (ECF subfamily)
MASGSPRGKPIHEWIIRARSGDREALNDLLRHYEPYLRRVVRSNMGPTLRRYHDTADLLQEVLLAVSSRFDYFEGLDEEEFLAWLRTLAARKAVDLARYVSRAKRQPGGDAVIESLDAVSEKGQYPELPADQTSPSRGAARRELQAELAAALAKLPDDEADVIWMRHVEEMSFEAIGQRLGLGRNAVRALWARALRHLREHLPEQL